MFQRDTRLCSGCAFALVRVFKSYLSSGPRALPQQCAPQPGLPSPLGFVLLLQVFDPADVALYVFLIGFCVCVCPNQCLSIIYFLMTHDLEHYFLNCAMRWNLLVLLLVGLILFHEAVVGWRLHYDRRTQEGSQAWHPCWGDENSSGLAGPSPGGVSFSGPPLHQVMLGFLTVWSWDPKGSISRSPTVQALISLLHVC